MRIALGVLLAGLALASASARAEDAAKTWDFNGVTKAATKTEIRARVTGYVTRVNVKDSEAVKKGDLLVEVDARPYQLALDAALSRMKEAEARLALAKLNTVNAQRLREKQAISADELTVSAANEAEAQAALMTAKVEVQRAELTLSWTRITAPFDGRVSKLQATEGSLIVADQSPILSVISTSSLQVSFKVPEAIFLLLQKEALADPSKLTVTVGFTGDDGFPHATKLDLIEPLIEPTTGTVRFQATLLNPHGMLLPGMSARVRVGALAK
jgi:RND family efflux transporter MFP subunit